MVILHDSMIRFPALLALKCLQLRGLGILALKSKSFLLNLSPEAKSLLDICQSLWESRFRSADVCRLSEDKLLHEYAEDFLEKLNYDGLLMLSLLTWHFNASVHNFPTAALPPRELLEFFSRSTGNLEQLCEILWSRYNAFSERKLTLGAFKAKFKKLVSFLEHGSGLYFLASSR
ncbi:uncharacterized protein ATNIH1004_011814 [Aspergillus tanneri]|uniref:Uncharacterized protein n=1 Tax=Aspergillus tanneri TaxID=1220188 RepID=A0A5M9M4I9_9EURO|nr:uncharacterized protein ATNIH1004_011814 [Aspergillus tanneri]KAA8641678.1 hypothetical protein ATNIH1004_011814 [Aspergillus tanneri]